jgi:hypothetical protein
MKLFKKKAVEDLDYRAMQQLASDLHNLSAAIALIMRRNGCEAPEIGEPLPDAMRKVLTCLTKMERDLAIARLQAGEVMPLA